MRSSLADNGEAVASVGVYPVLARTASAATLAPTAADARLIAGWA